MYQVRSNARRKPSGIQTKSQQNQFERKSDKHTEDIYIFNLVTQIQRENRESIAWKT